MLTKQPINSMSDLVTLAIQRLATTKLLDVDADVINIDNIKKHTWQTIMNTMWLLMRYMKSHDMVNDKLTADYAKQPFILTVKGYQYRGQTPNYVWIHNMDDEVLMDYSTPMQRLVKHVSRIDGTVNIDDSFYHDHKNELPHGFINRFKHHLNPVVIPVDFDKLPALTSSDELDVEQQDFNQHIEHKNWTQRLFEHVQYIANERFDGFFYEQDLIDTTLFITGFIRQHYNHYVGMDVNNNKEYSPWHNSFVSSESKSNKWPNRWFQIQYLNPEDNVEIKRPIEVINPSIDKLIAKYPMVSRQGYLFDEFKDYDDVIELYLHQHPQQLQNLLKKYCHQSGIKPAKITSGDWHALDWDDLDDLPLPNIGKMDRQMAQYLLLK